MFNLTVHELHVQVAQVQRRGEKPQRSTEALDPAGDLVRDEPVHQMQTDQDPDPGQSW